MITSNLRAVFEHILRNYGTNVYLQRRIIDEIPAGTAFGPSNLNNYYSNTLEKYTVRYVYSGRKTAITSSGNQRPEGLAHAVNYIFYFPHYAHPKEDDRVYLEDDRMPDLETDWYVDYAHPIRGLNGEIVYIEVGCSRNNPS